MGMEMKKGMFLLPWLSLGFLGLGMYFGFCSSYAYAGDGLRSVILLFLLSGVISFVMLQLKKNWVWAGTAAFLFFALVVLVLYKDRLQADGQTLLYYINQKAISYSGRGIVSGEFKIAAAGDGKLLLYYICSIVFLYSAFFGFRERWKLFGMVPFFCGAFIGVPVGKMPGKKSLLCLLAGVILGLFWMTSQEKGGSSAFKQKERKTFQGSFQICLLLLFIFGIGVCFASGVTNGTQKRILGKYEIYLKKQHKFERNAKAYMEQIGRMLRSCIGLDVDGNLSNDSPRYTNQVIMKVTLDEKPEQSIYLKSYVGGQYKDGKWISADEKGNRWLLGSKADTQALWSQGFMGLSGVENGFEGMNAQKIQIRYVGIGKWGRSASVPYFTDVRNHDKEEEANKALTLIGDCFAERKSNSYELPCYSIGQSMQWEVANSPYLRRSSTKEYEKLINRLFQNNYRRYVEQEYEKLPKGSVSRLQNYASQNRSSLVGENEQSTIANIRRVLHSTAKYSKKLDAVPEGEDYVEYFFFTQKKGFCEHFATTGTLLLRSCGIPARYVSGYRVDASKFKQNSDGTYTASVRDSAAHAWSEVFTNDLGWVPAEMTPGVGGAQGRTLRRLTHAEEMGMGKYATNMENQEHGVVKDLTEEDTVKKKAKKSAVTTERNSYMGYVILAFMAAVAIYILISRFKHWIERMKLKSRRGQRTEYVIYDVRLLLRFLRKFGISKISKMNDKEWLNEVKYRLPSKVVDKDLLEVERIIQKACFAKADITEEEYEFYCMHSKKIRKWMFESKNVLIRRFRLLTGDYKRSKI